MIAFAIHIYLLSLTCHNLLDKLYQLTGTAKNNKDSD